MDRIAKDRDSSDGRRIDENECRFLVALNASEEASLWELRRELSSFDIDSIDVADILGQLLRDGTLWVCERTLSSSRDCTLEESVAKVEKWSSAASGQTPDFFLYLTGAGWARWEADDWGISTPRARQLMSWPRAGFTRVLGGSEKVSAEADGKGGGADAE